jgi:O-antigen/teichoic acid export membrane protein
MIFFKNLENYFWAFIFPFWIGVLITGVHFYKLIFSKGKVFLTNFKKLIKYGSWQTFTGILGQFISQLGTILLALYATSKDIGLFGIATSLSLVFTIVGSNISSYFMPIGSRLKSTDEIKPFIIRTFRLVLPIAIICFISLFFSKQIIGLLYGMEKINAVPIFILLSVTSIVSFIFVSTGIILHYFLKPYLFTIEAFIRGSVLVILAYFLGREGVIGIALSYLIAGMIGLVVISAMVGLEYKKRKLKGI